jgi:nitroimidazol reductase NimA-like FMN-containing flavoprotein (pyridoxamine 5'-phosphate oxidase superfamily)
MKGPFPKRSAQGEDPTGKEEMRRKDKEITDKKDIEEIVKKATVCRIGLSAEESLASVCIVCIHIEKMTGKKTGY